MFNSFGGLYLTFLSDLLFLNLLLFNRKLYWGFLDLDLRLEGKILEMVSQKSGEVGFDFNGILISDLLHELKG